MVCVSPQADEVDAAARGLKRMRLPSVETALHEAGGESAGAAAVAVPAAEQHGGGGDGRAGEARADAADGAPRSPDETGERLLRAPRLADDSDDGAAWHQLCLVFVCASCVWRAKRPAAHGRARG
jgi:hypothetical protein